MNVCLISNGTIYPMEYGSTDVHDNDFYIGLYLSDYIWAYIICWTGWNVNEMTKLVNFLLIGHEYGLIDHRIEKLYLNNDWVIRSFDMGYIKDFQNIQESELVGMQAVTVMYSKFSDTDPGCNVTWELEQAIPVVIENLLLNYRMENGYRMSSYEKKYHCQRRLNALFVLWASDNDNEKQIIRNAVKSIYRYLRKYYLTINKNLSLTLNREFFEDFVEEYTSCDWCSTNLRDFVLEKLDLDE